MNNLLAPNGKPSNLTPEQYKLVRTPEFKAWFGDWENDPSNASKVVDENGEPKVVTHSTPNEDSEGNKYNYPPFNIFYGNRIFKTSNTSVIPIWFSYKGNYVIHDTVVNMPFFIKIKKLFLFNDKNHLKQLQDYMIKKYNNYDVDLEYDYNNNWEAIENENLPAYLNELGFDGYKTDSENAIAIFNSEQGKLADGTNTKFDMMNPDIRFAKGGKVIILPADVQKYKKIGIEDKYFIEASKDVGLQGVNFDYISLLKKIANEFNTLLNNYSDYIISEDSPSITSYIKNEIATKTELGASVEEIERLEQSIENQYSRNQIISEIAETQRASLVQWVEYLRQSNYDVPFKYLMFKAILTFNYDLKQNKLFERGSTTIRNFTPFDAGSLSELDYKKSDFLLLDYVSLMNENSARILKSQEVIQENKDGKWIKFKGGRNTSSEDIEKNGKELMRLVQNTYWCTKEAGTRQLKGGDFYVYVIETNGEVFPRIAVRMNEDKVGEVRGNNSSAQDLDADMLPIAEEFLTKNIPNDSGKKWLDAIKYNKSCVELRRKIEKEGLYKNFIFDYIKIISEKDKYKLDYGDNGNVTFLIRTFERYRENLPNEYYNKSDIVSNYLDLNKETLYLIGGLNSYALKELRDKGLDMTELKNWKLKVISKSLDCGDIITDLGNIEYIGEDLKLSTSTIDLGKLKYIGNNLDMGSSNIKSLNELEYIGNGFTINSKIKDLGKLKKVGFLNVIACEDNFTLGELEEVEGDLFITVFDKNIDMGKLNKVGGSFIANKTLITDLKELKSVGKNFEINGSKIKVFTNLKTIGGDADFSNNFASSTQNIETILGSAKFLNSRIMEFPNLKKIGGHIKFKGSFFKDLGNIEYIGGNLNLAESKVEDLAKLNYVGGFASFKDSKIVSLKNLKQIVGFANFDMSLVEDLGALESIGGNAYFNQTKIKSIGKLNYIGGFTQFQGNKNLEEQWLKKINEK